MVSTTFTKDGGGGKAKPASVSARVGRSAGVRGGARGQRRARAEGDDQGKRLYCGDDHVSATQAARGRLTAQEAALGEVAGQQQKVCNLKIHSPNLYQDVNQQHFGR